MDPVRGPTHANVACVHIVLTYARAVHPDDGGAQAAGDEPRAYHHGNLRRELLDAAMRLFASRGTLDFNLRELAREVGVTHNAPYRHFKSKTELLAALRQEGFEHLAERERVALVRLGDDASARARVRALGEAYLFFALAEPLAFRIMLAHPVEPGLDRTSLETESFAILERALERARATGEVRADLSPRELALGAWSLVHGLASLLVSGRLPASQARVRRYAETLATIFFDGAAEPRRAEPPPPPPKRGARKLPG